MTDLIPFEFRNSNVRVVTINGKPWFVAGDVCYILGYSNSRDAVAKHVRDHQRGTSRIATSSGEQVVTIISEFGLYRLMMRARTELADEFQDWVTDEVLPAIRETGRYDVAERRALPKSYAEALRELAATVEAKDAAEQKVIELEPAAQAWDELVDTGTTLDVAAAAKKLTENGIPTGRTRLYDYMREIGWVFKYSTQPKQSAVDTGWVTVDWGKKFTNSKTGEEGQGQAKTRVTAKGLAELQRRLSVPRIGPVAS